MEIDSKFAETNLDSIISDPTGKSLNELSQLIKDALTHPGESRLEAKIDELVSAIYQLIQIQERQPVGQSLVNIKDLSGFQEPSKRRYKTGKDEAIINAAITAIMSHNNTQALQNFKWAITINTLKAFSKNQRVIERILGKGKDNPGIGRIVGEREAEIENHHRYHQIQPGHNNCHKRKRKIIDIIHLSRLSEMDVL